MFNFSPGKHRIDLNSWKCHQELITLSITIMVAQASISSPRLFLLQTIPILIDMSHFLGVYEKPEILFASAPNG